MIAVSSIFTYDVYQTYINPQASGKRLIYTSHCMVVAYAFVMAAFSTGLYYAGISMGYIYLMMGVIISSAVLPAALTLMWSKQSWLAATLSPPLGLACSLAAWLAQTKAEFGTFSVATTGSNYPMLAGNVVALLSPCIFVPILTFLKPQNYDWESMKQIRKGDDHDIAASQNVDLELVPGETSKSEHEMAVEQMKLAKNGKIARYLTAFLAIALLVIWPMPMYGSKYIFSKKFFTGWISVGILWLFFSAFAVIVYPIVEGRGTLVRTTKAIVAELSGKGRPTRHITHGVAEESPVESVNEKVTTKA